MKNHAVIFLCIVAFTGILATSQENPVKNESARSYYDRGKASAAKGGFHEAIADLTKAIELDPNFADAYSNRGRARFATGDYPRAIADCTKAIELDPKLAGAYVLRGEARRMTGDYPGAIADCTKAIELDPKNDMAYNNRGNARERTGDLAGAKQDFAKAKELQNHDGEIGFDEVGEPEFDEHPTLHRAGETTNTVANEPEVDNNAMMEWQKYSELARQKSVQGRYDEAVEVAVAALKIAAENFGERHRETLNTMKDLADIYRQLGRYDDAQGLYEKVLIFTSESLGGNDPATLTANFNLSELYQVKFSHLIVDGAVDGITRKGHKKLLDTRGPSPKLITRTLWNWNIDPGAVVPNSDCSQIAFIQTERSVGKTSCTPPDAHGSYQLCIYDLQNRRRQIICSCQDMEGFIWLSNDLLVTKEMNGSRIRVWNMSGKMVFERTSLRVVGMDPARRQVIYSQDGRRFLTLCGQELSERELAVAECSLSLHDCLPAHGFFILFSETSPRTDKYAGYGPKLINAVYALDPQHGRLFPLFTLQKGISIEESQFLVGHDFMAVIRKDFMKHEYVALMHKQKYEKNYFGASDVKFIDRDMVKVVEEIDSQSYSRVQCKLRQNFPKTVPERTSPLAASPEIAGEAKKLLNQLSKDNVSDWLFKLEEQSTPLKYETIRLLYERWKKSFSHYRGDTLLTRALEDIFSDPEDVPDELLDFYVEFIFMNYSHEGFGLLYVLGPRIFPSMLNLLSTNWGAGSLQVMTEITAVRCFQWGQESRQRFAEYLLKLQENAPAKHKLYYAAFLFYSTGDKEHLKTLRRGLQSPDLMERAFSFGNLFAVLQVAMGWSTDDLMQYQRSAALFDNACKQMGEWLDRHSEEIYFDCAQRRCCWKPQYPGAVTQQMFQNVKPTGPSNIVREETKNTGTSSEPDWVNQTETAVGMVAIDTSRPKGQAIPMARRGAQIEAQRQILEKVLGLRIDSQTMVRDMVTESDKIDAQSSGLVRKAQVVSEAPDWANGVYKVTVSLKLYDVWSYMKEEKHYIK